MPGIRNNECQIGYITAADYALNLESCKGLDLIDRVPDELWTEVHGIVLGDRDQDQQEATNFLTE